MFGFNQSSALADDSQQDIIRKLREDNSFKLTRDEAYAFYDACLYRHYTEVTRELENIGYKRKGFFEFGRRKINPNKSDVKHLFKALDENNLTSAKRIATEIKSAGKLNALNNQKCLIHYIRQNQLHSAFVFAEAFDYKGIGLELLLELLFQSVKFDNEVVFGQLIQSLKSKATILSEDMCKSLTGDFNLFYQLGYMSSEREEVVKAFYWTKIFNLIYLRLPTDNKIQALFLHRCLQDLSALALIDLINLQKHTYAKVIPQLNLRAFNEAILIGLRFQGIPKEVLCQLARSDEGVEKLKVILPETHFQDVDGGRFVYIVYYIDNKAYNAMSFYDCAAIEAAKAGNVKYFEYFMRKISAKESNDYYPPLSNIARLCHHLALKHEHGPLVKYFQDQKVSYDEVLYPPRILTYILDKLKTNAADVSQPVSDERASDKHVLVH